MTAARTLVAGIGNIFLGDDGFGVEVVRRLSERLARLDVCVVDFGIRGLDLAYALLDYERAILVDAAPRGGRPGTLYVIEPELPAALEREAASGHSVAPPRALAIALQLGARLRFVRVVGCEPAQLASDGELAAGLSGAVAGAVDGAVALIEELLEAPDA